MLGSWLVKRKPWKYLILRGNDFLFCLAFFVFLSVFFIPVALNENGVYFLIPAIIAILCVGVSLYFLLQAIQGVFANCHTRKTAKQFGWKYKIGSVA